MTNTANKAASETRLRIRRMGDRELKKCRGKYSNEANCGAMDFWATIKEKILAMDDRQNKKPGGLGRKKAK